MRAAGWATSCRWTQRKSKPIQHERLARGAGNVVFLSCVSLSGSNRWLISPVMSLCRLLRCPIAVNCGWHLCVIRKAEGQPSKEKVNPSNMSIVGQVLRDGLLQDSKDDTGKLFSRPINHKQAHSCDLVHFIRTPRPRVTAPLSCTSPWITVRPNASSVISSPGRSSSLVVRSDLWAAIAWVLPTAPPLSRQAVVPLAWKVWQLAATPWPDRRTRPPSP